MPYPNPDPEQTVPAEAPRPATVVPEGRRVRVLFYLPGQTDPTANLWVDVLPEEGGETLVSLLHDYPDFHPEPGWRIEGAGPPLTILSASGRALTCALAHGGDA